MPGMPAGRILKQVLRRLALPIAAPTESPGLFTALHFAALQSLPVGALRALLRAEPMLVHIWLRLAPFARLRRIPAHLAARLRARW